MKLSPVELAAMGPLRKLHAVLPRLFWGRIGVFSASAATALARRCWLFSSSPRPVAVHPRRLPFVESPDRLATLSVQNPAVPRTWPTNFGSASSIPEC